MSRLARPARAPAAFVGGGTAVAAVGVLDEGVEHGGGRCHGAVVSNLVIGIALDGEAEVLGAGIGGAGGVGAVNLAFDRVQVLGAAALRGRFCQGLGQAEDERAGV